MSESRVLHQDMSNTNDRNIILVTHSKRRGTYKYPMFGQHNLAKQYFSNLIYKWNHCKYLFSCVFSLKTSSLSTLSLQYDKRIQDDLRGGKRKIRLVQEQVNLAGISDRIWAHFSLKGCRIWLVEDVCLSVLPSFTSTVTHTTSKVHCYVWIMHMAASHAH